MAKPELGTKRLCANCGTKFYDLSKNPAVCPKCATVYDPESNQRTRRSRSTTAAAKSTARTPPPPEIAEAPGEPAAPELEEAGIEIAEEEGEADEVIEDTEDLPEDDADVTEVIENADEEER